MSFGHRELDDREERSGSERLAVTYPDTRRLFREENLKRGVESSEDSQCMVWMSLSSSFRHIRLLCPHVIVASRVENICRVFERAPPARTKACWVLEEAENVLCILHLIANHQNNISH